MKRLALGLAIVLAGFALMIGGLALGVSTPNPLALLPLPALAWALVASGLAAFVVGRVLIARAGPPLKGGLSGDGQLPRGVEGDYEWVVNTQRNYLLARERTYRNVAILGIAVFVIDNVLFHEILQGSWSPSATTVTTVVGFWFVTLLVMIAPLAALNHRTSGFSPTRVGFNSIGLAFEYAPESERRPRKLPRNRRPIVDWSELQNVSEAPSFSLGPPTGVQMQTLANDYLQLWPLSPPLVKRILDEARSRGLVDA
jgi:hypothetical protein